MQKPATPIDETVRLRTLQSLRVLDTEPEERFDRITRLASKLFRVPIALVSLVDADRQWFKSRHGLQVCETSRDVAFCGHTILHEQTLVVPDTLRDERFADNPLVVDEPKIRFYAGHPVHGPDGSRIGTLCIIDREPREFTSGDVLALVDLAMMVDRELSLLARTATDELTMISNRRGLTQIAEHVLPLCRRNRQSGVLIAFDLDGFKLVNDSAGHAAGDAALRDFARLLVKNFRESDVIARTGGDEFCVLATGGTPAQIKASIQRLQVAFRGSELAARHPQLGFSCGVVEIDPSVPTRIDALLHAADTRMYAAKAARKAQHDGPSHRASSAGAR